MTQSGNKKYTSGLYIVATPIGNLGDISYRAVDTLKAADRIYCEDTRVTRKLLDAYDIKANLKVYNDHSGEKERKDIVTLLKKEALIALVSDAGMPLISDPGYKLVRTVQEAGCHVTSVPGPSSVLSALALSGLPSDAFYFGGFLPSKEKARQETLARVNTIPATLVFFETAGRLLKTLSGLSGLYARREVVIARELTKKFEEIKRGSPDKLLEEYQNDAAVLKGEIVLVIAPPSEKASLSDEEIDIKILKALEHHSLRDAVDQVMAETGLKRKAVYNRAVELKNNAGT